MPGDSGAVFSLYRSFRRQIRLLPTAYLRQFFRIKLNDDVRAILNTKKPRMQVLKVKRIEKELRKLKGANNGRTECFDHILDLAYGRKGKLKWELINPLLSDPNTPLPERIIPTEEKSRPPVYSPELTALLTSGLARKTRPIEHRMLRSPPTLPERAGPTSVQARLLGSFSKRREVNIRWRYFTEQVKKVYPPLQVSIEEKTESGEVRQYTDRDRLVRAGVRCMGMQGEGIFEEVQALARPPAKTPARQAPEDTSEAESAESSHSVESHLRPRFLRRRFARLLGRLPVLTYSHRSQANESENSGQSIGRYQVSLATNAIGYSLRRSPNRFPKVHPDDFAWIRSAEIEDERREEAEMQARAERAEKRMKMQLQATTNLNSGENESV
ncbi:hypothetical protein AcW1_000901 [Taiwanofungus camphoratus]|nr:hypothetical protein AcW1_000901 [Antrodia cinnamomea]